MYVLLMRIAVKQFVLGMSLFVPFILRLAIQCVGAFSDTNRDAMHASPDF